MKEILVSGVDLHTHHERGGMVYLIVSLQVDGDWIEVIREPYEDGNVIAHSAYSLGIIERIIHQRGLTRVSVSR